MILEIQIDQFIHLLIPPSQKNIRIFGPFFHENHSNFAYPKIIIRNPSHATKEHEQQKGLSSKVEMSACGVKSFRIMHAQSCYDRVILSRCSLEKYYSLETEQIG